jgi:hypothetical protein
VVYGCWSNDAEIVAWMTSHGVASYDDLLSYFVGKAQALAKVSEGEEPPRVRGSKGRRG